MDPGRARAAVRRARDGQAGLEPFPNREREVFEPQFPRPRRQRSRMAGACGVCEACNRLCLS